MARTSDRTRLRLRRHDRCPHQGERDSGGPRLAVHRSNWHISAQLIDDTTGRPWPPPRPWSRTARVTGGAVAVT